MVKKMRRKTDQVLSYLQEHHRPFHDLSVAAIVKAKECMRPFRLFQGERLVLRSGEREDFFYVIQGRVLVHKENGFFPLNDVDSRGHLFFFPGSRQFMTVEAVTDAQVVHVDSPGLEEILSWDQLARETGILDGGAEDEISLKGLMNTKAFRQLPLEAVEMAFQRMKKVCHAAGENVVVQGEKGDAFFLILEGRAQVWRQEIDDDEQKHVATLSKGDGFGEEALILGGTRNATVRMESDGLLLRMEKEDFDDLVATPLIRKVNPHIARAMMQNGYQLIDVRYQEEYEEKHIPDSRLFPLPDLRGRFGELDPEQRYLVICAQGKRASVGALLMRQHKVKEVVVVEGGLREWPFEMRRGF